MDHDPVLDAVGPRLRTIRQRRGATLAEHDFVMKPGEAAEFDTRVPHWFGAAGAQPAELLILFGPQGERMHVRAQPPQRASERP